MDKNVYVVVKLTSQEYQRIFKGSFVNITGDQVEAILSASELRSLNLWEAAKE